VSAAYKRAYSEIKVALNAKKRVTTSTRQRATEEAIQAVMNNYIIALSKRYTCD
jgi:hypothetical protein